MIRLYSCLPMVPSIIKEAFRQLSTKKHLINSPNLAQGIDVNTLDTLLQRSTSPSSLALPTLKYLEFLNPRQVCGLLQKLPQLERLHMHRLRHERRNQSAWSSEQLDISIKLMSALQARLSKIMHNCTSTQIEQGLWGLAVSNRGYPYKSQQLLTKSTAVADRLAEWLNASYQAITISSSASSTPPLKPVSTLLPSPNDRVHMTPKTLSMAAWWLATAGQGNHVAMAQIVSYLPSLLTNSMLQQTLPSTQQQPSTMIRLKSASTLKSKRRKREAARKGLTVADRVYKGLQPPTASVVAQKPLLDHRSLCRLAWAFASSGVKDEAAWRVICEAARSSLDTLLQDYDPSHGPLQPRKLYAYRTIQGWVKLTQPLPYRPSKYLRHNGPRVSLNSFDLVTLSSLVASLAQSRVIDTQLMASIEKVVVAMLPTHVEQPSLSAEETRKLLVLPGTSAGEIMGAAGKDLVDLSRVGLSWTVGPASGLPAGSVEAGTARAKVGAVLQNVKAQGISRSVAGRLLRGFLDLKYKSPDIATALLQHVRLFPCNVREIAAFSEISIALGLPISEEGRKLMQRLLNAAQPSVLMDAPHEISLKLNDAARKIGCLALLPES